MYKEEKVLPAISYDIALGKELNHIDINAALLSDIMRHYGMDDKSISETEIIISNDSNVYKKKGNTYILGGQYDRKDELIRVFANDEINTSRVLNKRYKDSDESEELMQEILNKVVAHSISETILHELQHRIDYAVHGEKFVHKEMNDQLDSKFNNVNKKSDKSIKFIWLGGAAVMASMHFLPSAEKPFIAIPGALLELYGLSLIPSSIKNGIKSIRYMKSHQGYLDRPHEVRARNFASTMVDYLKEKDVMPVVIDVKR